MKTPAFLRSRAARIAVAWLLPAAACLLQWFFFPTFTWFLFYPAVFFAAWIGGVWGGVGATLLSTILGWYFFTEPPQSFAIQDASQAVSVIVFAAMGFLFTLFHQRLRRQAEQYRALFEAAGDGVIVIADDGRCVDANPRLCALLGRPREEVIGARVYDHAVGLTPAYKEGIRAEIAQRGWATVELEVRRKDGTLLPAEITATRQGKDQTLSIVRDISERKRAERTIRESEARFSAIFRASPMWIILFRLSDGRCVDSNDACTRLTGYAREELIGHTAAELNLFVNPEERGLWMDALRREEIVQHVETTIRTKSGALRRIMGAFATIEIGGESLALAMSSDVTALREAEQAAQQSHDLLTKLSAQLPGMIFQFEMRPDGSYRVPYTSEMIRSIFGCAPEDVREDFSPIVRAILPEDLPAVMTAIARSAKEVSPFDCEYRVQLPGRPARWIWARSTPEAQPDGSILWHGWNTDISERKRLEAALAASEERLRLALDASNEGMWDWDLTTDVAVVNDQWYHLRGFAPGEIPTTLNSWYSMTYPDDVAAVERALKDYLEGRAPAYRAEYRIVMKSGEVQWRMSTGKVVAWDAEGKPTRLLGTDTDINERKLAEIERREAAEKLRLALDTADIGIWIWDTTTNMMDWDDRLCDWYEIPDDVRRSKQYADFWKARLHPDDLPRLTALLQESRRTGAPGDAEYRIMLPEGRVRHIRSAWIVERDARLLGVNRDITEQKRIEEERLEMERRLFKSQHMESLGVLAGGIAHDFNNLLTAILGNLELALMMDLSPVDEAKASIRNAITAGNRAAALTKQMLAYVGKGMYMVRPQDLSELIEKNAAILHAAVSNQGQLKLHLAQGLPAVRADASQMQQVVVSLLTNAAEAIGDNPGAVLLSTGAGEYDAAALSRSRIEEKPAPGRFVWIEVQDDGCGMDAETLRRLFDPFFSTKFTGRGLGMPAVLGIIRAHKGAIFVDSAVGQGTTVRVLLPAL
jgi:PAS domain S-box-containing protein